MPWFETPEEAVGVLHRVRLVGPSMTGWRAYCLTCESWITTAPVIFTEHAARHHAEIHGRRVGAEIRIED